MRNRKIDLYRGLLIILVVLGHSAENTVHDIIFLFHMPLFFVISGYLMNRKKLLDVGYLYNKYLVLIVPYITYLFLDFTLIGRCYSLKAIFKAIWGGRALGGTYWYITCFIAALVLFGFTLKHFSDRTTKLLIVSGGGYCSN